LNQALSQNGNLICHLAFETGSCWTFRSDRRAQFCLTNQWL